MSNVGRTVSIFPDKASLVITCCVSSLSSPWNVEYMTLEFRFFVPPKSLCRVFNIHPRNSVGSPCLVIWNRPALTRTTPCRNSCGLTCDLNNRWFQSFFARAAKRFNSSDSFPDGEYEERRRWSRSGGTCSSDWRMTLR